MRLIDADTLAFTHDYVTADGEPCITKAVIDDAPTIDAVPVVRCKDCKHSRNDELWRMRWCKGVTVKDEHFCADGERKDNE